MVGATVGEAVSEVAWAVVGEVVGAADWSIAPPAWEEATGGVFGSADPIRPLIIPPARPPPDDSAPGMARVTLKALSAEGVLAGWSMDPPIFPAAAPLPSTGCDGGGGLGS